VFRPRKQDGDMLLALLTRGFPEPPHLPIGQEFFFITLKIVFSSQLLRCHTSRTCALRRPFGSRSSRECLHVPRKATQTASSIDLASAIPLIYYSECQSRSLSRPSVDVDQELYDIFVSIILRPCFSSDMLHIKLLFDNSLACDEPYFMHTYVVIELMCILSWKPHFIKGSYVILQI
jgi:hypothetical protein